MFSTSHLLCLPCLIALSILGSISNAHAEDGGNDETSISFGIEGHYRVGRWSGVRYREAFTTIETRDGDGVQVEYTPSGGIEANAWGYAIPGSEGAPAILRHQDKTVADGRFPVASSPSRGPAMIPLQMPWIVAIGDALEIDKIGANELLDRDALIAVSKPKQADRFPDSPLGYDGVDMMLLGGSSADILATLDEKQRQAIVSWIVNGGRVLLTLGGSAPKLLDAAPWLQELLPLSEIDTVKVDPSAVETYTSSQTPLTSFVSLRLPKDKGRILIMGRTTRRVSIPVAVEYNVGFGRITVVAADLEEDTFSGWPERMDLITKLTGSILIPDQQSPQETTRSTAYADLAGQLRTTLDHFSIGRNYGFSLVSLILMLLVAAIGPLDYLLINRVFGKPLLGWLTFPIIAIGLSAVLMMESKPSIATERSETDSLGLHANRIEVFDIDAIQGIGRGFSASYLYSHEAASLDLQVDEQSSLSSISDHISDKFTAPFGYPGESFGGIQIAIEDSRLPAYQLPFGADSGQDSSLRGLPLASRSSKGVFTRFWFTPKLQQEVVMQNRAGSELLNGELVNPLPLDLLDGLLVYRNWAYRLPTRFPSGARVASVDSLGQKPFRWQLTRQVALESATENEAWDPASRDSPQRITEMLMFHDAVGGERYTTLQHDSLTFLDLSHVLANDRCILMGRLAKPLTKIGCTNLQHANADADQSNQEVLGDTLTYLRVVLPVENVRR
ncbi:MAG: hypothetical protein AB8B91_04850 [Rubripirellula sp.]